MKGCHVGVMLVVAVCLLAPPTLQGAEAGSAPAVAAPANAPEGGQVAALAAENARLQQQLTNLAAENAGLKAKVAALEKALAAMRQDPPTAERKMLVGDETPLTTVTADPYKFVGRTFIVIGEMRVTDYYNYEYDNARSTHVAFNIDEIRNDGSPTYKDIAVYGKRSEVASLVSLLTAAVQGGTGPIVVRAGLAILPERFDRDSDAMAELLDWQVYNPKTQEWDAWHSESAGASDARSRRR